MLYNVIPRNTFSGGKWWGLYTEVQLVYSLAYVYWAVAKTRKVILSINHEKLFFNIVLKLFY